VYVLEKNLVDDNGLPKWRAHAYRGVYVGHSDLHSSNVALIWNPVTKLVSAQYHIIFDEGFQTVSLLRSTLDHAAVQSTFGMLLKDTEWLHSDAFANTSRTNTQHYYFDNDWDLSSRQHNSTRSNGRQTAHTRHASRQEHDSATLPQNVPPAPPPASEGAQADQQELPDPLLLSQPLIDALSDPSEDRLPPNIVSQLCAIALEQPQEP